MALKKKVSMAVHAAFALLGLSAFGGLVWKAHKDSKKK